METRHYLCKFSVNLKLPPQKVYLKEYWWREGRKKEGKKEEEKKEGRKELHPHHID